MSNVQYQLLTKSCDVVNKNVRVQKVRCLEEPVTNSSDTLISTQTKKSLQLFC